MKKILKLTFLITMCLLGTSIFSLRCVADSVTILCPSIETIKKMAPLKNWTEENGNRWSVENPDSPSLDKIQLLSDSRRWDDAKVRYEHDSNWLNNKPDKASIYCTVGGFGITGFLPDDRYYSDCMLDGIFITKEEENTFIPCYGSVDANHCVLTCERPRD
ncbi:MAG: hypothetical protein K0R24_1387 [Gammaproteobacteria bacterium]|nr:hypothetical protein [Gammaproteobacteria bacterium]